MTAGLAPPALNSARRQPWLSDGDKPFCSALPSRSGGRRETPLQRVADLERICRASPTRPSPLPHPGRRCSRIAPSHCWLSHSHGSGRGVKVIFMHFALLLAAELPLSHGPLGKHAFQPCISLFQTRGQLGSDGRQTCVEQHRVSFPSCRPGLPGSSP